MGTYGITINRKDYVRAFIMDGNFKAEHMKMRNAHDDVSLGEGEEYMVDGHMYKAHLAIAKDAVDVSEIIIYSPLCRV